MDRGASEATEAVNTNQLAARRIRQARWLLELAAPTLSAPSIAHRLEMARRVLGEIAGDYQYGEVEKWAAIQERAPEELGPRPV